MHRKSYEIITEYGFYSKLTPKMQTSLIDLLFGKFLDLFLESFKGCERAFINRIIVSLKYK